jgi:hypothetical protein
MLLAWRATRVTEQGVDRRMKEGGYNEGLPWPIPVEIMVFPVLDWLFVLLGEYKSMRLKEI